MLKSIYDSKSFLLIEKMSKKAIARRFKKKYSAISNKNNVEINLPDFLCKFLKLHNDEILGHKLSPDLMAYVLNSISYKNGKTFNYKDGKPLYSQFLRAIDDNYSKHINYLIKKKIIKKTKGYSVNEHISNKFSLINESENRKNGKYIIRESWLIDVVNNPSIYWEKVFKKDIECAGDPDPIISMNKKFINNLKLAPGITLKKVRDNIEYWALVRNSTNAEHYNEIVEKIHKKKELNSFVQTSYNRNYDGMKYLPNAFKAWFVYGKDNEPIIDLDTPNSQPTFLAIQLFIDLKNSINEFYKGNKISNKTPFNKVFGKNEYVFNINKVTNTLQIEMKERRREEEDIEQLECYVSPSIDILELIKEIEIMLNACIYGDYYSLFVINSSNSKLEKNENVNPIGYMTKSSSKDGFMKLLNDKSNYFGVETKHWQIFRNRFPLIALFWKPLFDHLNELSDKMNDISYKYSTKVILKESSVKYQMVDRINKLKSSKSKFQFYDTHDGYLVSGYDEIKIKSCFKIITRNMFKKLGIKINNKYPALNLIKKDFNGSNQIAFYVSLRDFFIKNFPESEFNHFKPKAKAYELHTKVYTKPLSAGEKKELNDFLENDPYLNQAMTRNVNYKKDKGQFQRFICHPKLFLVAQLIKNCNYNSYEFRKSIKEYLN